MALLDVKIPPMGERSPPAFWPKVALRTARRQKDQPLFELETDKIHLRSTAEWAGKISLKVAAGAEVKTASRSRTMRSHISNPKPEVSAPAAIPQPSTTAENSPAVRRLAAETGVDPAKLAGTE